MIKWILSLLLVVSAQVFADGLSYNNQRNGYRFEVPPGWIQVPDTALAEKKKLMPPEAQRLGLDTAFQLGNYGDWMAHPYVTIQPIGFFTKGRPVTEPEFEQMITILRNINRLPEMKERLASMSQKTDAELMAIFSESVAKAKLMTDVNRRKYWMVVPSPYDKELYSVMGGTVLSNGMLVQLNGSFKKRNLKTFVPAFMRMFDSVRDF